MSGIRLLLALGLGLATASPALAGSDLAASVQVVEYPRLPPPAGLGQLVLPPAPGRASRVVILVPDALGEDGRAASYVDALAARGIASLVLGLTQQDGRSAQDVDPGSTAAAAEEALQWIIADGRFDPDVVGLLGFGAGGRSVLAAASGKPVVALYPGCAGLRLPPQGATLVLHGLEAPGAEACAAAPQRPGLQISGWAGLGHGWDASAISAEAGALVPDPAGTGRIRTRRDPGATVAVAEHVAAYLARELEARQLTVWMAP
jgi:dienelactone hydrolase